MFSEVEDGWAFGMAESTSKSGGFSKKKWSGWDSEGISKGQSKRDTENQEVIRHIGSSELWCDHEKSMVGHAVP